MKKKTINLVRVAMTLLFATFTSAGAWADYSTETVNLIQSEADWNNLAEYVASGNDCAGMTFQLTEDISVTRPIGRQINQAKTDAEKEMYRMRFAGTFDGNNKVLNITLNSADENYWKYEKGYCSPFAYVKNATIKNLHVTGTVTTTGPWASGLVGSTGNKQSDGACTIEKCQVSVAITANYVSTGSNYGNHGGFIGIAEGDATITDSWFDGKFLGKDYQYSAGFIGINKAAATLNNCLFNPSEINIENNKITGSCEFSHDMHNGTHTLEKAYWVSHFGEPENAQGQKVVTEVAMEIPEDGEEYSYYVEEVAAADFNAVNNNYYYIVKHNPTWEDLKIKMANGGQIELHGVIAGTKDEALVVPAGKDFTINLDGTLDRDLKFAEAKSDGYVIKVEQGGTLTINGGTITGGKNTGNGGGIYNAGTLNINGTTITENYTQGDGGGIYNVGTLNINGATITGNVSTKENCKGAGVYVADNGTINIQGDVQIHDNMYKIQKTTVVTAPDNLYLNTQMNILGSISGSSIGVQTSESDLVFTSGLENNGSLTYFSSDKEGYELALNGTEARLFVRTLELANDEANSGKLSSFNNKVAKVVLSGRTFVKNDNWNTLCLPFALSSFTGTPLQGATVMKFNLQKSGFANGTLTLEFIKVNSIVAGKPYIVKWTSGNSITAPAFEGVTVEDVEEETVKSTDGYVSFVGNYDPISIGEGGDNTMLYIGVNTENESTLYYPNGAMTIGACRAYFQLNNGIVAGDPASVRTIVMNFDDETTGIVTMAKETEVLKEGWFSLNGMKLYKQPTTKGLYILNGRKVVVK